MPRAQDVSVCLITKNEPFLKTALEAIRPWVSQIVVVLTGGVLSKDETALIDTLVEYDGMDAGLIDPATGKPCFNFSLARNRSFELARCKWLMWMDADDEVTGLESLQAELGFLEAQNQPLVQGMYPYEYAYDQFGNVTCTLHRERIMLRTGAKWEWAEPIHESILPIGHRHHRDAIVYKHHKDFSRIVESAHRNLSILRAIVAKAPNARNVYYLGMACHDNSLREEAIVWLSRFVTMTTYEDELHNAYRLLADLHLQLGRVEDAIPFAWKTVEVKETWLESWFLVARCYYQRANGTGDRRDWERCVRFGEIALRQPPTTSWHPVLPMVARHEIYVWLTRAYDMLGDSVNGLRMAEEGLKAVPNDPGLTFNRLLLQAAVDRDLMQRAATRLLAARGREKVVDLKVEAAFRDLAQMALGVFPAETAEAVAAPAVVDTTRHLYAVPSTLDIVFACGDGWVPWDPESIAKEGFGGGSEVAVVEMARRLAKRGHRVRVYNPCLRSGDHDGVDYRRWEKMQGHRLEAECDVLIEWRSTAWASKFDAHLKLLWLHDIVAWGPNPQVPATTAEITQACDFVLCVSEWHRQHVHSNQGVPLDRILKTRNGIAKPERFDPRANNLMVHPAGVYVPHPRDSHKVIWNMSPDRGLETLLGMWPDIRKAVPDATLHIFYGLETWKKMGHNPDAIARLEAQFEALKGSGVIYRGRVPPDVLAREMLTAGCWFYPNWVFPEVSCVAAMEAQAAGLRVVSSDYAALAETVNWGRLVAQDAPQGAAFFEKAWEALTSPEGGWRHADRTREEQASSALHRFSLDTLTDEWVALFKMKLEAKIEIPTLPLYEGVLP